MTEREPLSYRQSGVDIDEGERLVQAIGPIAKRTRRPECLDAIGGFGALFKVPTDRYKNPVLVSGTDGVGTKLLLARQLDRHNTIGVDLVAMCVNDVVVQGAEPLFFLDYFATGRLRAELATEVIGGIAEGCLQAGAALIGGESAEMPGMYNDTDYDLAGFCVGVVEQDNIINGLAAVKAGQALVGLASSGPHSNGYSLIRRVVDRYGDAIGSDPYPTRPFDDDTTLGEALLTPTRIYVKALLDLIDRVPVAALAHITGGGITDNVARVLPTGCRAVVERTSWRRPAVFDWLQDVGSIEDAEMLRTFNCGIGMVVVLDADKVSAAIAALGEHDIEAFEIGSIESVAGDASVSIV